MTMTKIACNVLHIKLTHRIADDLHTIQNPVFHITNCDETIPLEDGQSMTFTKTLMAPPAAPHVSGRVIQTSVWIPRSTHWLFVWLKDHALFTWENK